MGTVIPEIDAQYRQLREECGLLVRDGFLIEVSGADAAAYLQSQLTNDVEAVEPGEGVYAALLDRKGHVQADLRVLRISTDRYLLITEPAPGPALLGHLETYRVGYTAEISRDERALISLEGPAAGNVLGAVVGPVFSSKSISLDGIECLAVSTEGGTDVVCRPGDVDGIVSLLEARGAAPITEMAAEIVRVESGLPRFGHEIGPANLPAEVGIVERAVSFTKGCYIGQEPVARLHYKGSPNRFLRGLRFDGAVGAGDRLRLGDRELGSIGTAVLSPGEGWIGLAIVRKEAGPGDRVEVETGSGTVGAEVVEIPFPSSIGESP